MAQRKTDIPGGFVLKRKTASALEMWGAEDGPKRCHERIDQIAAKYKIKNLVK